MARYCSDATNESWTNRIVSKFQMYDFERWKGGGRGRSLIVTMRDNFENVPKKLFRKWIVYRLLLLIRKFNFSRLLVGGKRNTSSFFLFIPRGRPCFLIRNRITKLPKGWRGMLYVMWKGERSFKGICIEWI